ncbi:MAG: tetratricopeptide repeat protein [Planctomycetota bacterium]|jgi:tetratricopeptide (TPR) repeat protein
MPTVYNGVGTWYSGKSNVFRDYGECESCGREVILSSYDTTLYFVVIFVPLIPLGKKRVIWQCPVCKKHRHVSLAKWRQGKEKALGEARAKYEANPRDRNAAEELVSAFISYQEQDGFLEAVPEIAENHGRDAKLMKLVGRFYASLGYLAEADEALCASLWVGEDREVNEMLAEVLVRKLEPDAAGPYLQHLIDEQVSGKVGLLVFLAEGYQAVGEHGKALEVLDKAANIWSGLKKNKRYKQVRTVSEKNRSTGKRVKSKSLEPVAQSAPAPDWRAQIARAAGPAVLALVLAIYIGAAYRAGRSQDVYFVNGLSRPYTVKVNRAAHLLRPLRPVNVSVPEGPVVVEVADGPNVPSRTFEVRTSFWLRPFVKKTFVINPDGVAPVLLEKTYYAPDNVLVPPDEHTVYVGDSFYEFDRPDYVFEVFPEKLTVSTDRKKLAKERLCLPEAEAAQPEEIANMVMEVYGAEAVEMFRRHVEYEPEEGIYVHYYYSMVEPNEFIRTAQGGLEVRPVAVDLHRLYQEAMESAEPDYNITAEYNRLLEKEPENARLQYLFGRVARDPNQAQRLFEQSVSSENPCLYGYYALGYHKMGMGQFEEGLELARKAMTIGPDILVFSAWYRSILEAAGHYDELMQEYKKERERDPEDFSLMAGQLDLLVIQGKRKEAQEKFENWLEIMKGRLNVELVEELGKTMEARVAYLSGDLDDWVRLVGQRADESYQYAVALSRGEPVDEQEVERLQLKDAYAYLVIYVGEERAGRSDAAERFLSKGVELLRRQGWEERRVSRLLGGEQEPVVEEVCALAMEPKTKAIVLTAMGVKYPEQRQAYFELARRLNYNRHYPYLFLKSVLEE